MAVLLVCYDLKKAGRKYELVVEYLHQFTGFRLLESVWLLDTKMPTEAIRDSLRSLVDANDVMLVTRLVRDWGAYNLNCGSCLNAAGEHRYTAAFMT